MPFHLGKLVKFKPLILSLVGLSGKIVNTKSHIPLKQCSIEEEEEFPSEDTYIKNRRIQHATEFIEKYRTTHDIVGMSVAISVNGETVLEKGFGWYDLENNVKATASMSCIIASISKLFTAHLHLIIVCNRRGGMNHQRALKTRITDYIKELETLSFFTYDQNGQLDNQYQYLPIYPFPVKWLMTHESGLNHNDHLDFWRFEAPDKMYNVWRENLIGCCAEHPNGQLRRLFGYWPGTRHEYTSIGVDLLGAICEKLEEIRISESVRFRDIMTEEFCRLGLTNTYLYEDKNVDNNQASGYSYLLENSDLAEQNCYSAVDCNQVDPVEPMTRRRRPLYNKPHLNYEFFHPSEGIVSNVGDLVKFGNFYLRMYQGVEKPFSRAKSVVSNMWTAQSRLSYSNNFHRDDNQDVGKQSVQGLMWCIDTKNITPGMYKTTAHHNGSAMGYNSNLSITFLQNRNRCKLLGVPDIAYITPDQLDSDSSSDDQLYGSLPLKTSKSFSNPSGRVSVLKKEDPTYRGITVAVISTCALETTTDQDGLTTALTDIFFDELFPN